MGRLAPVYPVLKKHAEHLDRRVARIKSEDPRDDVKLLATRYLALLAARRKAFGQIMEEHEFMGKAEPTTIKAEVSSDRKRTVETATGKTENAPERKRRSDPPVSVGDDTPLERKRSSDPPRDRNEETGDRRKDSGAVDRIPKASIVDRSAKDREAREGAKERELRERAVHERERADRERMRSSKETLGVASSLKRPRPEGADRERQVTPRR